MTEKSEMQQAGPSGPFAESAARAMLKSAVRLAGLGFWTWNLSTHELALSAEAQAIFGEPSADSTFASWLEHVAPSDAERLQDIEDQVRGGQAIFSFEYSFRTPDGSSKRLKSDGEVVAVGNPLR